MSDIERLSTVFASLRGKNIFAFLDLAWSSGAEPHPYVDHVTEVLERRGDAPHGFVCAHHADLQRLVDGNSELPLRFWRISNDLTPQERDVALSTLTALREAGFQARWEHEHGIARRAANKPIIVADVSVKRLPLEVDRGLPFTLRPWGLSLDNLRPPRQKESPDKVRPTERRYTASSVQSPGPHLQLASVVCRTSSWGDDCTAAQISWPADWTDFEAVGTSIFTMDGLHPHVLFEFPSATELLVRVPRGVALNNRKTKVDAGDYCRRLSGHHVRIEYGSLEPDDRAE